MAASCWPRMLRSSGWGSARGALSWIVALVDGVPEHLPGDFLRHAGQLLHRDVDADLRLHPLHQLAGVLLLRQPGAAEAVLQLGVDLLLADLREQLLAGLQQQLAQAVP